MGIMNVDPTLLGERIRQARERKGLSQERLARLIERDQRAVSEYERGSRRIAVTDLPRLAEALDVPLLYFFGEDLTERDLDYEILDVFHALPDAESQRAALDIMRVFSRMLNR